ncbi:Multidrug resistance protein B [Providencia rustigianii]|nr:Multidrug resistance protein B [Providencia rustigianii]
MAEIKPLKGSKLVWATIALSLATFMQVLDSTIANVAIPTIAGNLGVSVSQGTWVITSFGVSNAISIAISGFLAKRFWGDKGLPVGYCAIYAIFITVWFFRQPRHADFMSRVARCGCRSGYPALTEPDHALLST